MNYCQRDSRWASHPLGYGPNLGTIGQYGCLDCTWADIATWAGYPITPPALDELFAAHHSPPNDTIFLRDPTGTYDFLPDNALERLWPARFKFLGVQPGLHNDVIAKVLPTPDQYAYVALAASGGRTHFAPIVAAGKIGDPWTGLTTALSAYTGTGWSVTRTGIVRALPKPVPAPPSPTPLPTPAPVPMETVDWDRIEELGHQAHAHPSG